MSPVDIILVGAVTVLIFGCIVHFFVVRTQIEHVRNETVLNDQAIKLLQSTPGTAQLSEQFVELHRKVLALETTVENQGLQLTDARDTLEHRFNRLRMRQQRERAEEGEEVEPVDPEDAEQLLAELNGASPAGEQQVVPQRPRLRRKVQRDKFGRT